LVRLNIAFDLGVGLGGDLPQLEKDLAESLLGDIGPGLDKIAFLEKELFLDGFSLEDDEPAELPEMNPAQVEADVIHNG
jgi:hypothetical protein